MNAQQLYETSSKFHCEQTLEHAKANGWLEEFNNHRRHPDTIVGRVLSIKAADDLWTQSASNGLLLVSALGMGLWSNHTEKVCFLTDDTQYGWKVLKERGWTCCSFRHRGTAHRTFNSFKEFLAHYDPDHQVIESEEELLAYLNGE